MESDNAQDTDSLLYSIAYFLWPTVQSGHEKPKMTLESTVPYIRYILSYDIILSCLGVGIEYKKLLIMSVLNHDFCYFSCPKRH